LEIINGHEVEFDELNHAYYVDGIRVLSVSQICKLENQEMYLGVDQQTLNNAARKGQGLHKTLELYEQEGIIDHRSQELSNYIEIKKKLNLKMQHTERMVLIEIDGKVVCAGRFDLMGTIEGIPALIDFKRTSQIHHDYVKLQLNLYALGLKQSYGDIVSKLMMIRLRFNEVDVVPFDIDEDYALSVLRKYVKHDAV